MMANTEVSLGPCHEQMRPTNPIPEWNPDHGIFMGRPPTCARAVILSATPPSVHAKRKVRPADEETRSICNGHTAKELIPKRMEIVPEGKNFRLAQDDELPAILDFLSEHLPDALKFHQTLKTFLKERVWDFFFYVTKTWPEEPVCLHFPGMTKTPHGRMYESFSVFCPCDRLECLQLVEEEDVLIDWTQPLYLNFTHSLIMDHLEKFYSSLGGTMEKTCGDIYVCSNPPEPVELEELNSEEAEVQQLKPEHAKAIHDLYPANDMEGVEIFEKLISALPAYGIFSSGELAAWMVQSYYGAMFSMQTKPEFRRKGYGIHLAQTLTRVVIARGYIPFVVIRPENDASQSLYTKLGFKKHYQTVRAILRPQGYEEDSAGGATAPQPATAPEPQPKTEATDQ